MVFHYKGHPIFADVTGFSTIIRGSTFNADTMEELVNLIDS